MAVYQVKLSDQIIRLWIVRALHNLIENDKEINFDNILDEIKLFTDVVWISIGLSSSDIERIRSVYNNSESV